LAIAICGEKQPAFVDLTREETRTMNWNELKKDMREEWNEGKQGYIHGVFLMIAFIVWWLAT
jgi:hypothetical protein